MDIRSSKLIVTVYLVFALVVAVAAYVGYRWYVRNSVLIDLARTSLDANGSPKRPPNRPTARARRPSMSADEESRTIGQLRELLDRKTALLQKRSARLEQKTAEYQQLQREADRHLMLLIDLLSEDFTDAAGLSPDATLSPNVASNGQQREDEVDADILATELTAAQWELEQARTQSSELQVSALRELETSAAAARAIIETGAPAVPALITLLRDDSPHVRRWAATMLGRIGPDAFDAVDALLAALNDDEIDVRTAARSALEEISGDL